MRSSLHPGISSPLLYPLGSPHPEKDGGKAGRREREGLTATALSPGWVERNEILPSSFLWVFGSRSCLPGGVTPLHCLCALLCVCCATTDVPPAVTSLRAVAPSPASLSLSLSPYLLFTEDYSPFPTLPSHRAAPLPSVRGERLARRGSRKVREARAQLATEGLTAGFALGLYRVH